MDGARPAVPTPTRPPVDRHGRGRNRRRHGHRRRTGRQQGQDGEAGGDRQHDEHRQSGPPLPQMERQMGRARPAGRSSSPRRGGSARPARCDGRRRRPAPEGSAPRARGGSPEPTRRRRAQGQAPCPTAGPGSSTPCGDGRGQLRPRRHGIASTRRSPGRLDRTGRAPACGGTRPGPRSRSRPRTARRPGVVAISRRRLVKLGAHGLVAIPRRRLVRLGASVAEPIPRRRLVELGAHGAVPIPGRRLGTTELSRRGLVNVGHAHRNVVEPLVERIGRALVVELGRQGVVAGA